RPGAPAARTRGSARSRGARSRAGRSRRAAPFRPESTAWSWGNHGFPHARSGCPDSNWGPLRPERSALPGCATPRGAKGSGFRGRLPVTTGTRRILGTMLRAVLLDVDFTLFRPGPELGP